MSPQRITSVLSIALAAMLPACTSLNGPRSETNAKPMAELTNALQSIQRRYAPDDHLGIFKIGPDSRGGRLALTGYVDNAAAKVDALSAVRATGARISDHIVVLPEADLAETSWGVVCLSVANGREQPHNSAEMGTQVLMGYAVRVWKRSQIWYLVQTADRYVCWMEKGSFQLCPAAEVEAWNNSTLFIVTAFEERVLDAPRNGSQPVTDVVLGGLLKRTGEDGDWLKVELPDHRAGYLPRSAAADYTAWKRSRQATPANIELTARSLLGRPYLWGANSPRGLDCSGFNKLVFFLNGIGLDRNASHQCKQGIAVPLDADLSQLRKGDLIFFGSRGSANRPERITHTGIYLGDKLFIHASERVRINSLDPASPISDARRIRGLIHARRVIRD